MAESHVTFDPLQQELEEIVPKHHHQSASKKKVFLVVISFLISLVSFIGQTELAAQLSATHNYHEPFLLMYLTHSSWIILFPGQVLIVATYKWLKQMLRHRWSRGASGGYSAVGAPTTPVRKPGFSAAVYRQLQQVYSTAEITMVHNLKAHRDSWLLFPRVPHPERAMAFGHGHAHHISPWWYIWRSAMLLCVVLTVGASTWYVAVNLTTAGDLTAIYNTSCFFAYLFSLKMLDEKFSWEKISSVIIAITGIFIVAYSKSDPSVKEYKYRMEGNALIAVGAVLYGLYEVLYKKLSCPPAHLVSAKRQATFSNFNASLLGLATLCLMTVGLILAELCGFHVFRFPTERQAWVLLSTSVLCNVLFCASFLILTSLTSPVYSSVSSLVSIFGVGVVEWVGFGNKMSWSQIFGYFLVIVSFGVLSYASRAEIQEEEEEEEEEEETDD